METTNYSMYSIEQLDQLLNEYEKRIGLSTFDKLNKNEIDKYLQMSRNLLEKLSPEDCAQIAYILNAYSIYVQKTYNREIAKVKWGNAILNQSIADLMKTHDRYITYEERKNHAIKNNDYANKVYQIITHAQARADQIYFLSTHINNTANTLLQLQRAKLGNRANVN